MFRNSNDLNNVGLGSCAVGGIFANKSQLENKKNIELILEVLKKLPHRGGQIFTEYKGEVVRVGDGAGVTANIDWEYYNQIISRLGIEKPQDRPCGIANLFLPIDEGAKKDALLAFQRICKKFGVKILANQKNQAWRKIPFDSQDSESAKELKLQNFWQCFLAPEKEIDAKEFEKTLLKLHAEIERFSYNLDQDYLSQKKRAPKFAVASISCEKVIYKGMLLPEEVENFSDLRESNPTNILYHIRQSTNISPSPGNAQPFYIIAHNGELNSSDGNADKNHKPSRGFSDSRTFDEHLRELTLQGHDIIEALTMLMPPSKTHSAKVDDMIEDMRLRDLEYNGPAHMVFFTDKIKGAKLDNSALRPSRYLIARAAKDGELHLIIGSEDMFSTQDLAELGLEAVERGMLKAGEMIIIENGIVKKNEQILDELQMRYKSSGQAVEKISAPKNPKLPEALEIGQRELEVRKYQLTPLCEGSIKKMAMGDDTNPMKTDERDVPLVADHLRQKFSQVSSPPLDPEKESASFSLKTYLGNKTLSHKDHPLLAIDSPVLKLGELDSIRAKAGHDAEKIDITVDLTAIPESDRGDEKKVLEFLQFKIRNICLRAEKAARAGKTIIVLDGSNINASRMSLPDILVTAAVHSYLHKYHLEKKASIIVNSSELETAHHFSMLSALGASAVNPIGAYDFATKLANGDEEKAHGFCKNFAKAVEKAHLVTMAKYGISSAQVYCGSRLVESSTLDLENGDEFDPANIKNAFRSVKYCDGFNGKFTTADLLTSHIIKHQRSYGKEIFTSGHFAYSASGVAHTYNPTVVRAIRGITLEYSAKRNLVTQNLKTADKLAKKLTELQQNPQFDFAAHKQELVTQIDSLNRTISANDLEIRRLGNQNEKLFNSLFFIDAIAAELDKVAQEYKKSHQQSEFGVREGQEQKFSLNEAVIRQFLSVVSNRIGISVTEIIKKYKKENHDIEDLKKALITKAGYDADEFDAIKNWAQLVRDEKAEEAAKIFATLNETNKNRITEVYAEYNENLAHINNLKAQNKDAQTTQLLHNISLSLANNSANQTNYYAAIAAKITELRSEAEKNNLLPTTRDGVFDVEEMNARPVDAAFKKAMDEIVQNKKNSSVTIADHLDIVYPENPRPVENVETVAEILAARMVTGGMSHGALTLKAHNDIAKAAKLTGGKSCTGEGGKPDGQEAKIVQVASGRFGLNPEYFADADTVEIKVVQGAKPGEGGMLGADKVILSIASKRSSLVNTFLLSPPPHHDIYSIEDLQELIHDLKELKPKVNVSVKICASQGVGEIAVGLAKSGADIINVAGASGGTGAAPVDAIKSTGLSSEIGLVIAHHALAAAGIRNLVKLQTSGFPNTAEGIIAMAILGGDILESGTTDLMLLGCDMHRKCNVPGACGPGITNNEEGYQGHAEDLALYKLNLARSVHDTLKKLGVRSLTELRGRTDLLSADRLKGKVSDEFITSLLAESRQYPQLPEEKLQEYRVNANKGSNLQQYQALENQGLDAKIKSDQKTIFNGGTVDVTNRTYGTTLAFKYHQDLVGKAEDHCTIKTFGNAGQSFGAFNTHGICLDHEGSVQDGLGKSMTGGVVVVKRAWQENNLKNSANSVYSGNAIFYGASGGKGFVDGAGSRCAILMKGATLVVNGKTGDYACEYMTSGSFVALGPVGKHFGSGMCGGIAVIYNKNNYLDNQKISDDVRYAANDEAQEYHEALWHLLHEDYERTQNPQVLQILHNFEQERHNFKIIIPKTLDKIKTVEDLTLQWHSFLGRDNVRKHGEAMISPFERRWFEITHEKLLEAQQTQPEKSSPDQANQMCEALVDNVADHKDIMRRYGPVARRIVGGLGTPDQLLSDNVEELMDELFDHGKKCSCDSVTCTSDNKDLEKDDKHSSSGCPLSKNPNQINAILNDKHLTAEQRAQEAFKMQIQASPFAGFTGAACPAPCEDSCTHSSSDESNADAVKIKRIELLLHKIAFLKGWYDESKVFEKAPQMLAKKTMIIGSGPSALEAAYHLAKKGVQVEIFEKDDKIGGLLRYGIPDHKLQKDTIDFYVTKLKEMGVKFHVNHKVNMAALKTNYPNFNLYLDGRGVVDAPVLFDPNFNRTNIEEGGNHSLAMDFLTYCNKFLAQKQDDIAITHPFEKFKLGKNVTVLGAGDTAEDVKRTILKLNAKLPTEQRLNLITLNRQPKQEERTKIGSGYPLAREVESQDLAYESQHEEHQSKVSHRDNTSPKRFVCDANGRISGVECESTYTANPELARQYRTRAETVSSHVIPCDSVITALGFKAPELAAGTIKHLRQLNDTAIVPIGDIATKSGFVTGSELIVNSQATGKQVAQAYLRAMNRETKTEATPSSEYVVPNLAEALQSYYKERKQQDQYESGRF